MDKITLIPSAIVVKGHIAYMFSQYVNLLYLYDFEKKETRLLGSIPEEEFFMNDLCGKMLLYNDYIILVPLKAKKIWKYNLKTNEWHGIELRPMVSKNCFKFYQGLISGNKVVMIGCFYPSIVTLDLSSDKLEYHTEVFDFFSSCKSNDAFFRVDYAMVDRNIYLASCKTNVVAKINIDNYNCHFYEVGKKNNSYSGIAYDGENFWLSPRSSTTVVKWDGVESVYEFELSPTISSCRVNYMGIIAYQNAIIVPGYAAPTLQIVNDKLEIIDNKYNIYQCNDNIVISGFGDGDVIFKKVDGNFVKIKCSIGRDVFNEYIRKCLHKKIVINNNLVENRTIDLKYFIENFVSSRR